MSEDWLRPSDEQPKVRHRRPGSFAFPPIVVIAAVVAVVVIVAGVLVVKFAGSSSPTHAAAGPSRSPSGSPSAGSRPPVIASPQVLPSASASCVDRYLSAMSVQQLAGQVLMIGAQLSAPSGVVATAQKYQVGGVFLAGRSTGAASTLRHDIALIQQAAPSGVPFQIGLDQEGGQVQTLQGPDFPPIPTAVDQGKESTTTLQANTRAWAVRLHDVGITIDLAPVSDTVPASLGTTNPPIGYYQREYGFTPSTVSQAVTTVVTSIQGVGVQTTIKHFPGLGRVLYNTDKSTKAVDSQTTADDATLDPFKAGIKAGTTAVMVSSASYPKLDPNDIAPFSSAIMTGLLRQKLGFTGLVMSDDFGAAVAVGTVPIGQRAVRFITAGGDLVLTNQMSDTGPMVAALASQAQSSPAFHSRLSDAARHVLASKAAGGILHC